MIGLRRLPVSRLVVRRGRGRPRVATPGRPPVAMIWRGVAGRSAAMVGPRRRIVRRLVTVGRAVLLTRGPATGGLLRLMVSRLVGASRPAGVGRGPATGGLLRLM